MSRYLKMDEIEACTIQIENLKNTVVNKFEDLEENVDDNVEVVELK